jgi:hypothetical protein
MADVAKMDSGGIAEVGRADGTTVEVALSGDVRGNVDTANADTRVADLGTDAPISDARGADARDVLNLDASLTDVRSPDASRLEGGLPIDASIVDVATLDSTSPDTGSMEVGTPDGAGPRPAIVVSLGLASPFAIAATAGLTNTITAPATHINGNVVLTPGATCNAVATDNAGGFGLCAGMPPTINGTVITGLYPDTTTATAVKADMNAAFLSLTPPAGPPAVGSLGGGTAMAAPTTLGNTAGNPLVLGDNWFTPGVYTSITSLLVTGDITLDAQNDPNAVFVFQSASTLTTADGAPSPGAHARILLTNGAKASNVWWQVASSATLGSYTEFQGSILAAFDITMKTGATACGRSMAGAWVGGTGAFIVDSNVVSVPGNGCPL